MKYARIAFAGLCAALGVWLVGMFLSWDVYGFWLVDGEEVECANATRFMMLYGFIGGCVVRAGLWERTA